LKELPKWRKKEPINGVKNKDEKDLLNNATTYAEFIKHQTSPEMENELKKFLNHKPKKKPLNLRELLLDPSNELSLEQKNALIKDLRNGDIKAMAKKLNEIIDYFYDKLIRIHPKIKMSKQEVIYPWQTHQ
jgi:hypothetical protein